MKAKIRWFYLLIVWGLLLGIGLSGCEPVADKQGTRYNDLVLWITTNNKHPGIGDQVVIHFTVTNEGKQPVWEFAVDRPVLDLQVVDGSSDKVLLSWSALHPDQAAQELTWQPGETKTLDLVWTPKEGEVYYFTPIHLIGSLSELRQEVKSAGLSICLGGCDR